MINNPGSTINKNHTLNSGDISPANSIDREKEPNKYWVLLYNAFHTIEELHILFLRFNPEQIIN